MARRGWVLVLCAIAASQLGALDVRLAGGASLHTARYRPVREPLDNAPLLFGTAAVDLVQDETALVSSVAAGWGSDALDWEAVIGIRHMLAVDWGDVAPFLQAGIGWATRTAGGHVFETTALFPEAVIGIEAATAGPTLDLSACYRPAPLPLPQLEGQQYPLRRFCVAVSARWVIARGAREPGGRAQ
jgi:hypothetical protein